MMTLQAENVKVDLVQRPTCEDIIVLRYDMDAIEYDDILEVHKNIADQFPNNKVITLPNDVSLNFYSKGEAEELLKQIEENIKKYLEVGQN